MPSVIDICNSALDKLGHSPIMSLNDGDKKANLCKRNWPLVRDRVLRAYPWSFAVTRAALSSANPAPAYGFSARFPYPTDLLRLIEVDNMSTGEFQVEGRNILANADVLYIRYIARVEDPNLYDQLFGDSAATRLAFEMCESIVQNGTKKGQLWEEYQVSLSTAKNTDAMENPPKEFEEDPWLEVRY